MGSDHDMIRPHAKYREAVRKEIIQRFIMLCAPRQLGAHKIAKTLTETGLFWSILCMWSDRNSIRPYANYRRREWPGSRSEKKKMALAMLGSHKTCERPEWPISNYPTVCFGCNLACDRIMIGSDGMQSYSVANGRESVRKKGIRLATVCEKSVSRFFFFL
jgi:hypothetical protein